MKKVTIFSIQMMSNLFKINGLRACRFHPSCSNYAAEAFERFGWGKAFWLMCKRLLRCQPFSSGGYDPLPGKG
ncbi:MAG: membrane protein insertion efficiency factor YidD [Candidatus Omnitrophota bacterium]